MNRPRTLARAGFTLVELLVSITLTIFILALFATLFGAGNDAVRAARGSGEVDRSVQGSITKIRRDLDHVFIGEGIKLSEAFASPNTIPNAGYFTLEENLPASLPWYVQSVDAANAIPNNTPAHDTNFKARVQAINARLQITPPSGYTGPGQPAVGYRQGIDDRGLPVEVDVDDVLAFTVRLSGDSPSDVFYGRVPVGSVLDNDLDPGSRFDSPNNGQFTSPMAEVCYFLRADRPYELAEINRPALGTDDGRLAAAATFTLYRRELLVLSESQRVKVEERLGSVSALADVNQVISIPAKLAQNPSLNAATGAATFNPSLYQQYDVAFRYDPRLGLVRFNDAAALTLRQNRYGMQWRESVALPFPSGASFDRVLSPQGCAPFYDASLFPGHGNAPPYSDLSVASAGGTILLSVPNRPAVAGVRNIFRGRPTLFESTLVGSQSITDGLYDPEVANGQAGSWDFGNANFRFDDPVNAARPVSARRGNGDVLLNNVLSFDVKVLNDDALQGVQGVQRIPSDQTAADLGLGFTPNANVPIAPSDLGTWPAVRTSLLPSIDPDDASYLVPPNPSLRPGSTAGNSSRRTNSGFPISPALLQSDFIDLGRTLMAEVPGGDGQLGFLGQPRWPISEDVKMIGYGAASPVVLAKSVPWGRHTPARWATLGRREAWSHPLNAGALRNRPGAVYDTWSPRYSPNSYAWIPPGPAQAVPSYLPPYDRPLRGIQITIRTLEPRSGVVREFQIVHRF